MSLGRDGRNAVDCGVQGMEGDTGTGQILSRSVVVGGGNDKKMEGVGSRKGILFLFLFHGRLERIVF